MAEAIKVRKAADYRSETKPTWCPGCGDFGVLSAMYKAFAQLNLDPKQIVVVSGIGCSGRLPEFVGGYGFHGVHGRVLPTAMGVKLANPELTVVAVGGDGDGFAIGGGHVPHAARRNVDITYLVMDNQIYSLTKGQPSPTTPPGMAAVRVSPSMSKMAPAGVHELPINPLAMVLAYGGSFVARAFSSQPNQLVELLVLALQHRGFAFIQAISPCVTFYDSYDRWKEDVAPLPAGWDPSSRVRALDLALAEEKRHLGLWYREERPAYDETIGAVRPVAAAERAAVLERLLDSFA
ncbi:MAG: 2-oxoacid:ferredoxin oxidoreductase subunit beta [Armatimonadetes bacterium]|jgi:2-oxoglutarate ferredoxin oxidoreductase subunit beta|nr:2-oxoacid:ferredoxin oxidoreductase subunit beta [Armatimonadota bacterium]